MRRRPQRIISDVQDHCPYTSVFGRRNCPERLAELQADASSPATDDISRLQLRIAQHFDWLHNTYAAVSETPGDCMANAAQGFAASAEFARNVSQFVWAVVCDGRKPLSHQCQARTITLSPDSVQNFSS